MNFPIFASLPKIALLIGLLCLLILPFTSCAQNTFKVNCFTIDSLSRQAIPGIACYVSDATGQVLAGSQTDGTGRATLTGIAGTSPIVLVCSALGYQRIQRKIVFSSEGILDLTISMMAKAHGLQEVAVKGTQPLITFEEDRMLLDISQVPNRLHMTTDEVLDYLPFLQVDEQTIKLMGEALVVLINNKPHPIYKDSRSLHLLPSHAIDRVEVTLVPTARQGTRQRVLNIILKPNYYLGWNGQINMQGSRLGVAPQAKISYWYTKYGIDLGLDVNAVSSGSTTATTITNGLSGTGVEQALTATNYFSNQLAYLSGYYSPSTHHLFEAALSFGQSTNWQHTFQMAHTTQYSTTQADRNSHATAGNGSLSLNYTYKFVKPKRELYVLTNYVFSTPSTAYKLAQQTDTPMATASLEQYAHDNRVQGVTGQVDYQDRSRSNLKYLVGAKLVRRWSTDTYARFVYRTQPLPDTATQAAMYNGGQMLVAAYADVDWKGSFGSVHAGLRLDEFWQVFAGQTHQYLNATPTISISRSLRTKYQVTFNYTREVRQPGLNYLAPFAQSVTLYENQTGNPALSPQYTHRVSAQGYGTIKAVALSVSGEYSLTANRIDDFTHPLASGAVVQTAINVDKYHTVMVGLGVEMRLGKVRWSHLSNGSYLWLATDDLIQQQWSGYLSERFTYQLSPKQRFDMSLVAFSPNLLPQGREQSVAYPNTTFRYSYYPTLRKKYPVGLSLSLSNPWFWSNLPSYTNLTGDGLVYDQRTYRQNPVLSASVFLSFAGKEYGKQTTRTGRSIQNDEIKTRE